MITRAGEVRFSAVYRVSGTKRESHARAWDICLEQTVELPLDVVPEGFVRDQVVGRIESLRKGPGGYRAIISYAAGSAAGELTQLLNVLFGNISIKPGIRLEQIILPPAMLAGFRGPTFGRTGLRRQLGVPRRPLLCAALKPMGLPSEGLAELAHEFARGGIDIVKDDHGLSDQPYARFEERVRLCAKAVLKANRKTGFRCAYAPNITAPYAELLDRARFARAAGAGALLVSPGLAGLDAMRAVADDSRVGLPILSHPAFQGSYVLHPETGISHYALFGQIARLAGADASIYPNYGGRFSFSKEECRNIAEGCRVPMGRLRSILPCPGGGMNLGRVPELLKFYGNEVILLVGGGLLKHGPDVVENCRTFRKMVGG
ncbi:MAG TPA: RuBisCO large subunit C-terminal-like domain-containing protein [Candidatus Methylomirabilis sp.]|nr:RuBisCO large subunit C-terminal-like domain-containing protein [Candidatus Methylomirabilis sp.]